MKRYIIALLLCIPFSLFANSPIEIYRKVARANGFWLPPKLVIVNSNGIGAENLGVVIRITKGMIRSSNQHELAAVFGHELAHGRLWHLGSTHSNEYAADMLGMHFVKKAGYNRCAGAKMLLKLNSRASKTHPASIDRYNRVKC